MDKRLEVMIDAALAAGAAILKFDPTQLATQIKSSEGDFVTAADLAAQQAIVDIIKADYPDDIIISEEITDGQELLTAENLPHLTGWVIDPLDGTNNFKRDMAYSGISIAYILNGAAMLDAVYNPYRNELYQARKGGGATRNELSIHVSEKVSFDAGTRVCTSNSYEGGNQTNLARYAPLGDVWIDVLGSSVLIMTDVASGRLDLYYHNGLKPWDNAAAFLIAEEAGAKIADLSGQPTTWLTHELVMGNAALVDEFLAKTTPQIQ